MLSIRFPPLPTDTARATEAAFGIEHPYLKIGERLDDVMLNLDISSLVATDQGLADSLWPYSPVTILQFWEDLTDFQMANATRTRLDLKYALHLSLNFPGFDPSSLCRFRHHLLLNETGKELVQQIATRLVELVSPHARFSTDVDVILSRVCTLRQWEIAMETMSKAIEALAASYPEWLRSNTLPHWYKRYFKNNVQRKSKNIQSAILTVGQDGQYLLNAAEKSGLSTILQMREIQMIAQVWQSLFKNEGKRLELNALSCSSCPGRIEMNSAKNPISPRRSIQKIS